MAFLKGTNWGNHSGNQIWVKMFCSFKSILFLHVFQHLSQNSSVLPGITAVSLTQRMGSHDFLAGHRLGCQRKTGAAQLSPDRGPEKMKASYLKLRHDATLKSLGEALSSIFPSRPVIRKKGGTGTPPSQLTAVVGLQNDGTWKRWILLNMAIFGIFLLDF